MARRFYKVYLDATESVLSLHGEAIRKIHDHSNMEVLRAGRLPPGFVDRFRYSMRCDGVPHDYMGNSLSWKIVSERMRDALTCEKEVVGTLSRDVEFIPLPIEQLLPVEHRHRTWFLMHVMRVLNCLDHTRSTVRYSRVSPGSIAAIHNLRVRGDRIPDDVHLFRIEGTEPTTVVSSVIRNVWELQGVTGVGFLDVT